MGKTVNIHRENMPGWFRESGLGIFIHWGPYSVPAYAPAGDMSALELLRTKGPEYLFANQPYAEWYQNSLRIPGSPVAEHHARHYGDLGYEAFAARFRVSARQVDAEQWADIFARAGAQYVVLVTKHHDGFLLFDSRHKNPVRGEYQLDFDFTGELARACRARKLRFGTYYSSLLDWTFTKEPIVRFSDMVLCNDNSRAYRDYCLGHWTELIDRYSPDILWSDIGYPADRRLAGLFAYYYGRVPEGVVNDRWEQLPVLLRSSPGRALMDMLAEREFRKGTERTMRPARYYDYRTLEYSTEWTDIGCHFEMCRGMDKSFAYNRNSRPQDYVSPEDVRETIRSLRTVKGRLLLNVGPDEYGNIPEAQKRILESLAE
ncbi:MAG: alpha-L-fucosidase [Clostridia bacterium]